jgi:3-methylcrotonyl-CoA carboxylase alpha subunit
MGEIELARGLVDLSGRRTVGVDVRSRHRSTGLLSPMGATTISSGHGLRLVASMPGTIRSVPVAVGDRVAAGTTNVVIEAIKMELALTAPADGIVTEINVAVDDTVETGTRLAVISETDD